MSRTVGTKSECKVARECLRLLLRDTALDRAKLFDSDGTAERDTHEPSAQEYSKVRELE